MANKLKVVEIKSAELSGDALSYAVALATGTVDKKFRVGEDGSVKSVVSFEPGSNWYHGGPLFEQYNPTFQVRGLPNGGREFYAVLPASALLVGAWGPTHLIALSRAVVLGELGAVVEVPAAFVASHADALAKEKNADQGQLPLSGSELPPAIAKAAEELRQMPSPDEVKKTVAEGIASVSGEKAPEAKPATDKPATDKPAAKPTPAKPAPQGKHAQAMKDHGKPQGKGGK